MADAYTCAEWIPWMGAYRVFEPSRPQWTLIYEEDAGKLDDLAKENGFKGCIIRDADTMHADSAC